MQQTYVLDLNAYVEKIIDAMLDIIGYLDSIKIRVGGMEVSLAVLGLALIFISFVINVLFPMYEYSRFYDEGEEEDGD